MEISELEFQELKQKAEKSYFEIKKVHCPYFKREVIFDALGFNHILYKNAKHARPRGDQVMRFRLIKFVDVILKSSGTTQGISELDEWERVKSHGVLVSKLKRNKYYEFIAVISNYRIKIVVKETENGEFLFWSIIPFWRINKDTSRRVLHSMNFEE